ncbi:MAG TPA: DUF167 family protein [Beijerinckiaceae bacterium]|nr:DUF167 family protein [Beijerinckiaceae bacterium]
MSTPPFTAGSDHVIVRIRLTPNAHDSRIDGLRTLSDGSTVLAVRVRAIPEDGAANAALERLLAETAGVPRSAVQLIGGPAQRLKTIRIDGDPDTLRQRLVAATG